MGDSRPGSSSDHLSYSGEESIFPTRQLETFGRKVTATAGSLLGDQQVSHHYHNALGEIQRELRNPLLQRNVFALSQISPREAVRSKLSTSEIQHRALTYLPDEMLENIPETSSPFSLFQGFQATLPDPDNEKKRKRHSRRISRGRKLLEDEKTESPSVDNLRNEKHTLEHRLEMMDVRKNMCSTEIREIDNKIANLNSMRKIVLDRLADLEQEEQELEREIYDVDGRLDVAQEEADDAAALAGGQRTPTQSSEGGGEHTPDSPGMEASFMSESIYEKLPTPKTTKRPRPGRRKTNFILHEHLQSGSKIREFQAHYDSVSALDFDVPWGTMITAALDDTVRVWDLNAGRCIGLLEGHLSSVRCLQIEDNIVATGSMDATVRLWDLSQADYAPQIESHINKSQISDDEDGNDEDHTFTDAPEEPPEPPASNMRDCPIFTLTAHVAEVTALHFHKNTLISGSSDKTLRQWDLEKGRCVQTLDVLWAAAQASSSAGSPEADTTLRPTGRLANAGADFVGALQTFDAALACGTADGLVRLWDLRSGQVHRSLVGHTGPVTSLQFDDVHLVTGSADRSIRIWDLRTGSIYDAFAYDNPITSMQFDARQIVAAAGEDVVKVYDKTDGRQWDCGAGLSNDSDEVVEKGRHAIVERVRIKEGYMTEGRKDGVVGVWSC